MSRWQGIVLLGALITGGVVIFITDEGLYSGVTIWAALALVVAAGALFSLGNTLRHHQHSRPADHDRQPDSGGLPHHPAAARSWWRQPMNRSDTATVLVPLVIAAYTAHFTTAGYAWGLITIFVSSLGIVLLVVAYMLSDRGQHDEHTRPAYGNPHRNSSRSQRSRDELPSHRLRT